MNSHDIGGKLGPTKSETELEQKKKWLNEHLPYELMMARYSIAQLRDPSTFWLDWNAHYASFAMSARNLFKFLTNEDTGQNNLKACEFVQNFKSEKNILTNKAFQMLRQQVFHLGKARPSDEGKFTLSEAEQILDWIETEMEKFVPQLGLWTEYWNEGQSRPETRPVDPTFLVPLKRQTQSSAAATITFVSLPDGSTETKN